ncbi:MAG: HupE/UreJ family protein, partial [Gemmatimonadetes bacterium]|nr:HupE/UreJ family protein [Gemmatimonadota bacterium]
FGLVHGFGFSFALRDTLQFAGAQVVTSLLSFNVGVELGQLFALALIVPALGLLFRYVASERIATIILSALVAHTGWHWMTDRFGVLRQYQWQGLSVALLVSVVSWLAAIGILAVLGRLAFRGLRRLMERTTPRSRRARPRPVT